MKKPIILHIAPTLKIGGAEKFLVNLLTSFKTHPLNKFEHQVAYFTGGPYLENLKKLNVKTHQAKGILFSCDLVCLARLYKIIKQVKPVCIDSILWSANLHSRIIGKFLKIPVICGIHSHHNSGNINKDNKIKLAIDKASLNWSTKIIAVSKEISKETIKKFPHIKPAKIVAIDNGISISKKIEINSSKSKHFTIGHVGRFVPVKNQALIIKSLVFVKKKIPNFKALFIGYGPLEQELKNLASNLGLNRHVEFTYTTNAEAFYPKFDCFIQTSHKEGQSIALLEAMSAGIPPIITSSKGHNIIEHLNNGIICKPNNILDIAGSIIKLAQDIPLKTTLGKSAHKTVLEKHNLNFTATKYLELYNEIS